VQHADKFPGGIVYAHGERSFHGRRQEGDLYWISERAARRC